MYYTIKYYIDNNYTTLSAKQVKRNAKEAYQNGDPAVILRFNKKNLEQYEIHADEFERFGRRKRQQKKIKLNVIKEYVPRNNKKYQSAVTINFKDATSRKVYEEIIIQLFYRSGIDDMFYSIEVDESGFTHVHFASTATSEKLYVMLNQIINIEMKLDHTLKISKYGEKTYASIEISTLLNLEGFTIYISKEQPVIYLNVISQIWK